MATTDTCVRSWVEDLFRVCDGFLLSCESRSVLYTPDCASCDVIWCNPLPPTHTAVGGDHRAMLLIRPSEEKNSDFGGSSSSSAASGGFRLMTNSRTSRASMMRGTVRQQSRSLVLMWFTWQTKIGSGSRLQRYWRLKGQRGCGRRGVKVRLRLPEGDGQMASGPPGRLGHAGGSCWQKHLSPGDHRTRWSRSHGYPDPSGPSPVNQFQQSACGQWNSTGWKRLFFSSPSSPPQPAHHPPHVQRILLPNTTCSVRLDTNSHTHRRLEKVRFYTKCTFPSCTKCSRFILFHLPACYCVLNNPQFHSHMTLSHSQDRSHNKKEHSDLTSDDFPWYGSRCVNPKHFSFPQ